MGYLYNFPLLVTILIECAGMFLLSLIVFIDVYNDRKRIKNFALSVALCVVMGVFEILKMMYLIGSWIQLSR